MEEIYVIKLRGLPPSSPMSSDASPGETRDLLYDAILGLGILHLILGLVSFLLGSLGLAVEYDATHTGAGLWCGLIFFSTGLSSVLASRNRYQKLRMKICFCLSVTSTALAAIYLVVSCLGVAYFHQSQRKPHEIARIGGNTIVTAFLELVISVLSMFVSARTLWPCFWLSVSCGGVSSTRQKVIVSANVLGGNDAGLNGALSAVRQISPNCVISFRPPDDGLPDNTLKVEEYVRNGCHWSSTDSMMDSSAGSSLGDEVDRGDEYVDAENWRNVAVLHGQAQIIPYYPKDYSGATGC